MKRAIFLVLAILLSGTALAETVTGLPTIDRFDVQISPEFNCDCGETGFQKIRWQVAKGSVLRAWVSSDRPDAQYRYVLEKKVGAESTVVASSVWQSGISEFAIDTAVAAIPPGNYRLRMFARHDRVAELQERSATVRVIGPESGYYQRVKKQSTVSANYVDAIMRVRNALVEVKQRLARGEGVAAEFAMFSSTGSLVVDLLNPEGRSAPDGGGAYVDGYGDDATGAVGVNIVSPPVSLSDWRGTTVVIELPNYLDLDVNGDQEWAVVWEDMPDN